MFYWFTIALYTAVYYTALKNLKTARYYSPGSIYFWCICEKANKRETWSKNRHKLLCFGLKKKKINYFNFF